MLLPPRDHDQWKHHCLTGSLHQLIASVRSARSLSESTQTSRVIQPRPPPAPPRHHPPPRGSSPLAERRPRGIRHFSLPEILTLITKHTHPRAAKSRHHPAHRITRSSGRSSSSSSSNGVAHHDGVPLRRGAGARGGGARRARWRWRGRPPAGPSASTRRTTAARVRVQGRRRRRGRRAVMFAAAAVALSAIGAGAGGASAAFAESDVKRGTPEAKKKYAQICVTMPTAKVCHN